MLIVTFDLHLKSTYNPLTEQDDAGSATIFRGEVFLNSLESTESLKNQLGLRCARKEVSGTQDKKLKGHRCDIFSTTEAQHIASCRRGVSQRGIRRDKECKPDKPAISSRKMKLQ